MKREDFKEITKKHLESCRYLIKHKGSCFKLQCYDCPFRSRNSALNPKYTCWNYYGCDKFDINFSHEKLVESAKEFIKKFGGK